MIRNDTFDFIVDDIYGHPELKKSFKMIFYIPLSSTHSLGFTWRTNHLEQCGYPRLGGPSIRGSLGICVSMLMSITNRVPLD